MSEIPPSDPKIDDSLSPGRFVWEELEGQRVLRVLGEIDLSNARHALHALEGLGDGDLVVDLTDVEFMDSTGLGVLVELESKATGAVKLMVLDRSQVDRLLDLTGLKSHFRVDVVPRDQAS